MLGKRNRQFVAYGTDRLMRRYIMMCHKTSKAIESMVLFEAKEGLMCPKACLLSPTESADLVKDLYLQIVSYVLLYCPWSCFTITDVIFK